MSSAAALSTPQYWSSFYAERGAAAFEWYASFHEIRLAFSRHVPLSSPPPRVLVPGCGNSSLSEDLYRAGYTRTLSLDRDEGVIATMRAKTRVSCAGLEWAVGDAAALEATRYPAASFDALLDKGLLDALLPEEEDVARGGGTAADAYLAAAARLLSLGTGALVIVTLAQEHVLRHWVSRAAAFAGAWSACAMTPIAQATAHASPLCPYLVVLTRSRTSWVEVMSSITSVPPPLRITLGSLPRFGLVAPALKTEAEALSVGATGSAVDVFVLQGNATAPPAGLAPLMTAVEEQQWAYGVQRSLSSVTIGTYLSLDLWGGEGGTTIAAISPQGARPEVLGLPQSATPLYSVTVLDAPQLPSSNSSAPAPTAAVLLVPVGREHEWAFASRAGQAGLAASAHVARLIVVTLGTGSAVTARFARMSPSQVQAELSPVVITMVPAACAGRGSIPFLSVAEQLGHRTIVTEGVSPLSGAYTVEDVEAEDDEDEGGATKPSAFSHRRRLVFASNRAALQTEVRCSKDGVVTHEGALCFSYHRALASALRALLAHPHDVPRPHVLVVGLGGGALPAHLAALLPWVAVTAVELDAAVVDLAVANFGLPLGYATTLDAACGGKAAHDGDDEHAAAALGVTLIDAARLPAPGRVNVLVGDGLRVIALLAHTACASSARPAAIILDVNAGAAELRSGLSFPPHAFVSRTFLAAANAAVTAGGLLLLNLGARSKPLRAAVLAAVSGAFGGSCAVLARDEDEDEGEDINSVVIAGGGLRADKAKSKDADALLKGATWH